MKTVLFEGVVPPEKKEIRKLKKSELISVFFYTSMVLRNPFKLLNMFNVWNSNYSWEFNMVFKSLLDLARFNMMELDSEVAFFGGDSLGTITSSIAFNEVSKINGLKIVRKIGKINDRITATKPGLASIVYSTGREGGLLEATQHFSDLIRSKGVVLSVRLSDKLCVVVGPTVTIDKFIKVKPESIFIKILGRDKVTHYPAFKDLITKEDLAEISELSEGFTSTKKHLTNIVGKEDKVLETKEDFINEVVGCIDKVISVKQLYVNSKKEQIVVVGANEYLDDIISSL